MSNPRISELVKQQQLNPEDGGGLIQAHGTTVPADGTAGYAKGCCFRNLNGTDETDTVYFNIGTVESCNFNAATIASD